MISSHLNSGDNNLGTVLAGSIDSLIKRLETSSIELDGSETHHDQPLNGLGLPIGNLDSSSELAALVNQLPLSLHHFSNTLHMLRGNSKSPDYYASAFVQLSFISGLVDEIRRTSQRLSVSLDTVRRYERGTRATLRELLQYIQSREGENQFIGAREIQMNQGDSVLISPRGAYIFPEEITRRPWLREPYMADLADQHKGRSSRYKDGLKSMAVRLLTGESAILDEYTAERDGVVLPISPNEIGADIVTVNLAESPVIARSKVYFGNRRDVVRGVESPLSQISRGNFWSMLKKAAYGPGPVLQRFEARNGGENLDLLVQLDGDWKRIDLKDGETLPIDPRNVYLWQSNVSYDVVKFARAWEVIIRDTIPYKVVFQGPPKGIGSVWVSNKDYRNGYWGQFFTPSHWIHYAIDIAQNLATLPFKTGK